jgi:hypothetical protein
MRPVNTVLIRVSVREAIMMTSYNEMIERKKFQLALRRIVDLEQAILKAARVLENDYVRQEPNRSLMPPTSIIAELRAAVQTGA